jgi:hypothetical protein
MTYNRRKILSPEVRQRKEERLAHLEEQAAIYGIDVPPHIANEIEDLQAELELANIIARPVDNNLINAVKSTDYGELLAKFIGDHARRLTSIELWQSNRDLSLVEDGKERDKRRTELDRVLQRITVLVTVAIAIGVFNTLMFILYAFLSK